MYSSPELNSPKEFGKADHRTDIFQIGTIFYELVTGVNPFDGDTPSQILTNILNKSDKPSALNPEASGLDEIIMKCLAKEKDKRYQSVSELQDDLITYLKAEYKKSFRKSKTSGNMRTSCLFCGDIVIKCIESRDIIETLKWVRVLEEYAKGDDTKDIKSIIKELIYRRDEGLEIGDELIEKIKIVVHHIQRR